MLLGCRLAILRRGSSSRPVMTIDQVGKRRKLYGRWGSTRTENEEREALELVVMVTISTRFESSLFTWVCASRLLKYVVIRKVAASVPYWLRSRQSGGSTSSKGLFRPPTWNSTLSRRFSAQVRAFLPYYYIFDLHHPSHLPFILLHCTSADPEVVDHFTTSNPRETPRLSFSPAHPVYLP